MKQRLLYLLTILVLLNPFLNSQTHMSESIEKQHGAVKNNFHQQLLKGAQLITANQQSYDVNYYVLDLTADPGQGLLTGEAEIIFTAMSDSLDFIGLNFWDGMAIHSIYQTANPDSLLTFRRPNDILSVDLQTALSENEQTSISIVYSGYPQNSRLWFLFF